MGLRCGEGRDRGTSVGMEVVVGLVAMVGQWGSHYGEFQPDESN